jgi:hypothetical protein
VTHSIAWADLTRPHHCGGGTHPTLRPATRAGPLERSRQEERRRRCREDYRQRRSVGRDNIDKNTVSVTIDHDRFTLCSISSAGLTASFAASFNPFVPAPVVVAVAVALLRAVLLFDVGSGRGSGGTLCLMATDATTAAVALFRLAVVALESREPERLCVGGLAPAAETEDFEEIGLDSEGRESVESCECVCAAWTAIDEDSTGEGWCGMGAIGCCSCTVLTNGAKLGGS